jgi:hypothetical protein
MRAKLDPTGDPADAMSQFYVDAPSAVSARIAAELELAPATSHLLVGGVGSGKTTELLAIARRLGRIPDITTLYIDVTKHHDIAKMAPGSIVVQVGIDFADEIERSELKVDPQYLQAARDTAHEVWEGRGWLLEIDEELAWARGPLEGLLRTTQFQIQNLVVLLDGLDRMSNVRGFEQIVHHDVVTLRMLGIGVVLVGPLRTQYGIDRVIFQHFDSFHYQPWIDVTQDIARREFLRLVLAKRTGDALAPHALELIMQGSGGVLRDLLSLAQSSLVEAYMDGTEVVGTKEVSNAIDNFGRKHLQGLRSAELDVLQRVRTRGSFVQTSEDDLALLMTRRVLEYRTNHQPRYVVHPTIDGLLGELEE